MKFSKACGTSCLLVLTFITAGVLLLTAVCLLPTNRMKSHIADSDELFNYEGIYPQIISGYKSSQLDNYTDGLMYATAIHPGSGNPLKDAMRNARYEYEDTNMVQSLNDYANDGKGNLVFGLHDGTTVSSPQSASTTWQGDNWDGNSSETYWGTGLVSLNGSSITLRFESATQVRDEGTWATTQTIIPQTPGPIYDGPEKPTLKTTEVSYHHDVALICH